MERLRSPGTVRKLSLKMKKLPELRRKLSLRSASRAHRHGNDARGGGHEGESAGKDTTSNQNVISRYHLDSSAPPARPLRRSSRGRSASKGGKSQTKDSKYHDHHPQPRGDAISFQVILATVTPPSCCHGSKQHLPPYARTQRATSARFSCTWAPTHRDVARE